LTKPFICAVAVTFFTLQ